MNSAEHTSSSCETASHHTDDTGFIPDLHNRIESRGRLAGDKYVKIVRHNPEAFRQLTENILVAEPEGAAQRSPLGKVFLLAKRSLVGKALQSTEADHQRLSNTKALAVLSSDALSSVAYASEEILRVLLIAGLGALSLSLPIGACIVLLLVIVGASYRQTIKAYPHGGGSYIVAKDNLGEAPALVAGGALLVDYVLTVAVSISAAVGALVSAFPSVHEHLVLWGAFFIALVTMLNLRGIRESGSIFAVPTYLFLVSVAALIVIGLVRNGASGFDVHEPSREAMVGTSSITIFLVLRAFSSGCAALTGVEAISDGVPAFRKPEWQNARTTLAWMIGILAVMFAGITFLAHQYGAVPMEQSDSGYETVVSQIARGVFGGTNPAYYFMQFATILILVLAANTAYSDFPRLAYFMARDKYMPSQFMFRGDRLAYTFGIVTLGGLSIAILALFGGQTERLIPLYAVGVFTSFTLSQFGMVVRWNRLREPGWKSGRLLNGLGALATGLVAIVVAITKFTHGAWMVLLLIPLLVLTFRGIHRHYTGVAAQLKTITPSITGEIHHTMIVPVARLNAVSSQTLAYASSITTHVTAVHVTGDLENIPGIQSRWQQQHPDISLVIIESPYRSLVGPLIHYIENVRQRYPDAVVTVVLPEYVPNHWWEQILHNQTAFRIKAALLFRPGIVVTNVPYHLSNPTSPADGHTAHL